MWISDIKNHIFWNQISFFDITNSNSWNQTMIFDIQKCLVFLRSDFFYWYQEFESLISENVLFLISMWISDIKNLVFWYQKIIFWYHKFKFLKSDNDFWISNVWCFLYQTDFFYWYQEFESLISENVLFVISRMWISDIKSNSWYQKFTSLILKIKHFLYQKFKFLIEIKICLI